MEPRGIAARCRAADQGPCRLVEVVDAATGDVKVDQPVDLILHYSRLANARMAGMTSLATTLAS